MSGDNINVTFEQFLQVHQQQLVSSAIPDKYWLSLFEKLKDEVFDAGESFQMQMLVPEGEEGNESGNVEWQIAVTAEEGVSLDDPKHIYLIDHAWTYNCSEARSHLEDIPGLLGRMLGLMDIKEGEKTKEDKVEEVLRAMWKYNQTYSFGHFAIGTDESMPVWYVMDEFGSRIQHSDHPSFHVAPFAYVFSGVVYSIMWPLVALEEGDSVTRNYISLTTQEHPNTRQAHLIPWVPQDMKHISFKQEEPEDSFFESCRKEETLPSPTFEMPLLPKDRNLKVFTEYKLVADHLTDPRFEIVDSPEEADVLWYMSHYRDFKGLSERQPGALINQFPWESVVTTKDILAITSRRASKKDSDPMECDPLWLPTTYNLRTELPKFISYFQHREEQGLDNHWICKPWNLARALDTHVSKDLAHIVRLNESGPKVVGKYIENPVLFHRDDVGHVKFDLRYVILLTSVKPLEIYAYQVFWLRFANKPYSLDTFDDYHKHFTVMNYTNEGKRLKQIHYDDFIPMFEAQNPGFVWSDVENDIFVMFRELFEAATSVPPPRGIAQSPQSRAAYAVDLMLDWNTKPSGERYIQPKICEVNFSPDCDRACLYHPFFYNDLFSVMFLNDTEDKHVVPL